MPQPPASSLGGDRLGHADGGSRTSVPPSGSVEAEGRERGEEEEGSWRKCGKALASPREDPLAWGPLLNPTGHVYPGCSWGSWGATAPDPCLIVCGCGDLMLPLCPTVLSDTEPLLSSRGHCTATLLPLALGDSGARNTAPGPVTDPSKWCHQANRQPALPVGPGVPASLTLAVGALSRGRKAPVLFSFYLFILLLKVL